MRKLSCVLAIAIFSISSVQVTAQTKSLRSKFASIYSNTYLFAGMSLAKQQIRSGNFASPFNYDLSDIDKNIFKPGYFLGARLDNNYKHQFDYALLFSLSKVASGAIYKEPVTQSPFVGKFSHFKADEQFFNASITALYKKHLPISNVSKFNWYLVGGPSVDIRLSKQTEDNSALNAYRPFLLSGKIGAEFNNRSYYTLFFHYKQSIHSFTHTPIKTSMNGFELGMIVKASDIF